MDGIPGIAVIITCWHRQRGAAAKWLTFIPMYKGCRVVIMYNNKMI